MSTSFFAVSSQVLILFVLILVGFVCTKRRFFTGDCIAGLVKFTLYVVTPCVVIESFHRDFDARMLKLLGIAALCAVAAHAIGIALAHTCIRDKDESRRRVLQFGTVFSNCGYMALPLQNALLGSDGVFFGAAYIAVFNLLSWTYGLVLMSGNQSDMSAKKALLNPGVIGVACGLVFFLTPLALPPMLLTPIKSLAALNTPVPMVIIGYYLAGLTTLTVLKDARLCLTLVLRLVAAPALTFALLYAAGLRGTLLTSVIIAASAPSGANTIMFASMYGRDARLAGTLITTSTFFSVLTMPLIVAAAMSVG